MKIPGTPPESHLSAELGRPGEVVFDKRSPDRGVEFLEDGVHIGVNRWSWQGYDRPATLIYSGKE